MSTDTIVLYHVHSAFNRLPKRRKCLLVCFFTFVAVGDGGPGLVRVEVDVDASSSIGEEGVGQNHSFAVKGEIVSVVPAGKIRPN
jgi:hypothetical protein